MKKKGQSSHTDDGKVNRMELMNIVALAGSLGLTLFVGIMVGVFLGRTVDAYVGTSPWGMILFSLLGTASGFWSLYKRVIAYMNEQASTKEKKQ